STTMFFRAAQQSYLPTLVPARVLPRAWSRIEQTMTAAESVGPLLAGALIRLTSAPVVIVVTAATHAASALLLAGIRHPETAPQAAGRRHLVTDLREGASWVYRH